MTATGSNFQSDRHNLYVGWVLGIARLNGVGLKPVLDDAGNYTDCLELPPLLGLDDRPITVIIVVPPPPDDWMLTEWNGWAGQT